MTTKRKRKMRLHDLVEKFQYRDALDTVLKRDPVQIMAVIDELIYRNGLEVALQQRKDSVSDTFVAFCQVHVRSYSSSSSCLQRRVGYLRTDIKTFAWTNCFFNFNIELH